MNTRITPSSPFASIRRLLLASGAACALIAPAALAQGQAEHEENVIQGDFNRPLNEAGQPAEIGGTANSTTTIVEIRDGQKFQLEIRNGNISAKVNDEPVPAGRVQRQGNRVIIRDEAGKELHAFTMPRQTMGPAVVRRMNPLGQTNRGGQRGDIFIPAEPVEPPPVMIGITMDEPPADVARFLGLDENTAIQVGRVTEGLPAAKAGVQSGDIIVSIDGAKPANP
ncbi:MAG: PDZ domain-containing protein [Planctomycetota bacterium]|nr:PDZ domain-containing protein [Planctomycetota bacterium]